MKKASRSYIVLLAALFVSLPTTARSQLFWNQAASFAGNASSYIAVPNSTTLNITSDFTMECWINPSDATTTAQILFGKSGAAYDFRLSPSGLPIGRLALRTAGSTRLISRSSVVFNVWTHVAGVYTSASNTFAIYINGSLDTSTVIAGAAPTASTDSLFVGKGFNSPYQGLMDDVRIWNRALTTNEIRNNRRTELGASSGVYSGLVTSLMFQSSVNNTVFNTFDFSNNSNSGVNRGTTVVNLANRPYTYTTFNDCVNLDGTDDYLSGANTAAINITGSFTVECWVWPREVASPSAQILVSKRSGAGAGYEMYLNTGRVAVRTNGQTRLTGSSTIPNGYWSHVAATFNSATNAFTVYVNGVQDGAATVASAAPTAHTDSLFIGHGFNSDFSGYIDEVRIAPAARTAQEIKTYMYQSMDASNTLAGTVMYNLDGIAFSNDASTAGPYLRFNGNAAFANVSTVSNQPMSPLNRAAAQNFPAGFYLKTSNRRIPQTGTVGQMIPDSLFVSQSVSITDLNFYVATNHTFDSDMDITLQGPSGDSVNVCFDHSMLDNNDNIVTMFDDNADSSLTNNAYTSVAPRIKPQSNLNTVFGGRNSQGWWRLKINDDAAGDTGRVYFWGIQVNNQVLVGVEEIAGTVPEQFQLQQNYPNPFNPTTTIQFSVPRQALIAIRLYDILGREVRTLVNEDKSPGNYKVVFDATGLASGTYFYRLEAAGNFVETKKLMLLK